MESISTSLMIGPAARSTSSEVGKAESRHEHGSAAENDVFTLENQAAAR